MLNLSINNVQVLVKLIPWKALVRYNTTNGKYGSLRLLEKTAISLSGPIASIMAAIVSISVLLGTVEHFAMSQAIFFAIFQEYSQVPGIPYVLYAFYLSIKADLINILLVFGIINFLLCCFSLLPIIEHDLGKILFNTVIHFDNTSGTKFSVVYLIFSGVLKHTTYLAVLALSIMDIYRYII